MLNDETLKDTEIISKFSIQCKIICLFTVCNKWYCLQIKPYSQSPFFLFLLATFLFTGAFRAWTGGACSRNCRSCSVMKWNMRYACNRHIEASAASRIAGILKLPSAMLRPWFSLKDSPYQNVRTDNMIEAKRASTNTTFDAKYPAIKNIQFSF